MKKFNIILLAVLLLPVALNARKVYEAEKVVNHSFPASSNHTLIIENKYGPVNIQVWDKNEVSATITISGMSSRSQETADALVNRVKINANASGNSISIRTEIASTNISGSGTQSNEINYEIKVPRNIAFNLTNKYGNIKVDECGNKATIDVKYGNFHCTKMTDKNVSLTLGYGNANIQEVNGLTADIKYSNMTIGSAKTLNLTTKYSNLKLSNVGSLTTYSGYDDYKISEVATADIEAKYTSVKVDKVTESLVVVNKYGGVSVGEVGAKAKSLKFELGYTDLKLNISPSISYELDAYTKYGNISLPDGVSSNIKNRETQGNSTTVKATIGSSTPSLKVSASNSYANIKLTAK